MEQPEAHAPWTAILTDLNERSGVSAPLLGRVLGRVMLGGGMVGGPGVPRVEITKGSMLAVPTGELSTGTVSKATKALKDKGLLTAPSSRQGGPALPMSLGRDRWVVGIHIEDRHRQLRMLAGVLTRLDGEEIASIGLDPHDEYQIPSHASGEDEAVLVEAADKLVGLLRDKAQQDHGIQVSEQDILGVGLEIGGHVLNNGDVILKTGVPANRLRIGRELAARLRLPVVIENDVHARAIHALYQGRFAKTFNAVLVQVFDEGVGGALVIDGWVYRGGGGMAMEPGHLVVEHLPATPPPTSEPVPTDDTAHVIRGFADACLCNPSRYGHLDALATPARIVGQLGVSSLEAAACAPSLVQDAEDPDSLRLSEEGISSAAPAGRWGADLLTLSISSTPPSIAPPADRPRGPISANQRSPVPCCGRERSQ